MKRLFLLTSALIFSAAAAVISPSRAEDVVAAPALADVMSDAEALHDIEPPPVRFDDPVSALETSSPRRDPSFDLGMVHTPRRMHFVGLHGDSDDASGPRQFEFELAAGRDSTRLGLDVSVAQRANFDTNADGDIARAGQGSELRVGRGLVEAPSQPRWYVFAASDDEALTWAPQGSGAQSGGVSLQDRVEIGDRQAGVTYESGPVQASLAYVEREISVKTGITGSISREENFAGVTLTMRR